MYPVLKNAYVIEVKDKDGKVLVTYTIGPKTSVGTNSESAEVNHSQTDVISRTAVMAVGSAVSLVAVSAWLMRKAFRKKEDEE